MNTKLLLVYCVFLNLVLFCGGYRNEIRIGGIFEANNEDLELAFQLAIQKFNDNHPNLPFIITPITSRVKRSNTLKVSKEICNFLRSKIVGIFGPSYRDSSHYVQAVCDNKEMPHIETHWDKYLNRSNCLINLHPNPDTLKTVYVELVKAFNWKTFTIIYEDDESLSRISNLLSMFDNKKSLVTLRQIDPDSQGNYRPLLQLIKQSGEENFVLDCSMDVLEDFLKQAQQVSLMTERESYIITNLDLHTINLEPYQYSGSKIIGVRFINPETKEIIQLANKLQQLRMQKGIRNNYIADHIEAWKLRIEIILLIDSVTIFLDALKDLSLTKQIEGKQLYCNVKDSWEHGYSLINSMKTKNLKGLSGMIRFDHEGYRSDFSIDIIELTQSGVNKIATWNTTETFNITIPADILIEPLIEGSLKDRSFRVLIALTPPYSMLKETTTKLKGNDRFEGFGIDLIKELSAMLGFNYTFIIQEDGQNGNFDRKTKKWNGMIGEILEERADLAITDLTITSERLRDVDFTNPFMNLGISILYRKPEPMPPSLFTFASPFSTSVWLLLGIAYLFVSISFFIIGRLSPSEWNNPYPCVDDPDYLINQFTLRNSLWFTIGSLMQQGSEIAPVGISTRMASGVWWFFTLIMVSSYTANLAAFLTVETLVTPFKNIEELSKQIEVKYGAKGGGATSNFFRDSNITTHKRIWENIFLNPDLMTATNEDGVKKVETENYAFLMESTTIEYVVERHCTLAQVGGLLDDKGYGIAMKKNSVYRNILSAAVVKLQESGRLTEFKIKWWKEDRGGGKCEQRATTATPLDLKNLGGVFFVLVIGTISGVVNCFLEVVLHVYKKSKKENLCFKNELIQEFKIFVQFKTMERSISISNNNIKD